jgi:hypothetical protein
MRRTARPWLVAVVLCTLATLFFSGSVTAATWTVRQIAPGITQRTIWDTTQVHIIALPHGVDHKGTIHAELTFEPARADLDLYLLDDQGAVLQQEMGTMAVAPGREVVDFAVTEVRDQTVTLDGEGRREMTGDTYYLVVVAFNEAADYQLWGYYPRIDLDVGSSPSFDWNYHLEEFRYPTEPGDRAGIRGPDYGDPYDFRPTSLGDGECRLEWPAEIVDGEWQVTYDPTAAPMPADVEQYLYAGQRWAEVARHYGKVENHLPGPLPDGGYGLSDAFTVARSGAVTPMRLLHYVPSLFLAYADPLQGPNGGVRVGETTLGFKATLTYPENLRLDRVVPRPASYFLAGTLSLDGRRVPGAEVVIERQIKGGDWVTVTTLETDESGWWYVRLRPPHTWKVRARADGDAATGLAEECSVAATLKAL